jgi:serine/threonine protein kinase
LSDCFCTDFGMSKVIRVCQEKDKYKTEKGPIKWMAPESIKNLEFSFASDIWAFGITLHEIWTNGQDPYQDLTTRQVLLNVISGKNEFEISDAVPMEIRPIIRDCLQWDQFKRPRASELVSMLSRIPSKK